MLSDQQEAIIKKVCSDVFEQLAFMFAEDLSPDEVEYGDDVQCMHAAMTFSGHQSGGIEIVIPVSLASQLAKNILGLGDEETLTEHSPEDALREMLNTICGRMLTSLFGEDAVFNLHVPMTKIISPEQALAMARQDDCITLMIEENPIIVHPIL